MKISQFLYFVLILLFISACEEVPPVVSPIENQGDCTAEDDNVVANQQRQVLIEEFTGVRCVNCPAGSALIEDFLDQYGEQLIAVSIHEGPFSNPSSQSQFNFRTEDADQISILLGGVLGYPAAAVNRISVDGYEELTLGSSQWAKVISDELAIAPQVKLYIDEIFDESTRDLSIEVSIFPQQDIDENVRLSVFILEDNIVDYQKTPDGDVQDYNHKHVFRDAVTNADGNPIVEELNTRTRVCKSFTTTLADNWVIENCSIVAFVHLGGSEKNVLQAAKVKL